MPVLEMHRNDASDVLSFDEVELVGMQSELLDRFVLQRSLPASASLWDGQFLASAFLLNIRPKVNHATSWGAELPEVDSSFVENSRRCLVHVVALTKYDLTNANLDYLYAASQTRASVAV